MAENNIGIISAFIALAGVFVGGLITFFITLIQLRYQDKQRTRERKIKAYEDIHKHLSILAHQAGLYFIDISAKIKFAKSTEEKGRVTLPWQESEMLINFYTPELKDDLKIIKESWDKLGRAFALVVMEKYSAEEGPKELLILSLQLSNQIETQVNIAKTKLAKLVNKII